LDDSSSFTVLLSEDRIENLLAVILDRPVEGEIYEDDFTEVSRAINDFFTRKKSLIKNTSSSSIN
jgi:hypothetical protein